MPLIAPNLDTRSFADIKLELTKKIRQYAPEWTDFNESDPGITLVELFAHLTEIMLYEMNRLPELNYIKFLQLLDMQLAPPTPASAVLTFTPDGQNGIVQLPKGTQVEGTADGDPVVFELDRALDITATPLKYIQIYSAGAFSNATDLNDKPDALYYPFSSFPSGGSDGSALYLGFEKPDEQTERQLRESGRLFPSLVALYVFLSKTASSNSALEMRKVLTANPQQDFIEWEYIGGGIGNWRRFPFADLTEAMTREGFIYLQIPSDIEATNQGLLTRTEEAAYWIRCRLKSSNLTWRKIPQIDAIQANAAPATSLVTVHEELMGISEGTPNQRFALLNSPIDPQSLRLLVLPPQAGALVADSASLLAVQSDSAKAPDDESGNWEAVSDFFASMQDSRHFVLNAVTGEVVFGDGERGQIPLADFEIIAQSYRFGGGSTANLPANSITTLLSDASGANTLQVTNQRAALGGSKEQSLEDLKRRAPAELRTNRHAVTVDDYIALAMKIDGVLQATAIPNWKPPLPPDQLEGLHVPGAVTVLIVPETVPQRPQTETPPYPSEALLRTVGEYLYPLRVVTCELYVDQPSFVQVSVTAEVEIDPSASQDAVRDQVYQALQRYLDPKQREFNETFYLSSLYEVILSIQYVRAVTNLEANRSTFAGGSLSGSLPERLSLGEPLKLKPEEIIFGAKHNIKCRLARRFTR